MAVILVDGDGTCWPQAPHGFYSKKDIGSAAVLKELVNHGHQLVLWTCRNKSKKNPYNYHLKDKSWRKETSLDEALRWFKDRDIPLAGINAYLPGEKYIGRTQKPLADLIIDDTALGIPVIEDEVDVYSVKTGRKSACPRKTKYVDWGKVKTLLVERGLL
jgi:hypothetical protein